jgi:2-iminobutanoate/2-iminopropanoate deaminase
MMTSILNLFIIFERKKMKKVIHTADAPAAIGPYSQAVAVNNLLYTSGQIALDPNSGELKDESLSQETHQVMTNMEAVLKAGSTSFEHVVKTTIFLKDMNDFNAVNEIYATYFKDSFPARETVQVAKLPKDVRVEISMIALIP